MEAEAEFQSEGREIMRVDNEHKLSGAGGAWGYSQPARIHIIMFPHLAALTRHGN